MHQTVAASSSLRPGNGHVKDLLLLRVDDVKELSARSMLHDRQHLPGVRTANAGEFFLAPFNRIGPKRLKRDCSRCRHRLNLVEVVSARTRVQAEIYDRLRLHDRGAVTEDGG